MHSPWAPMAGDDIPVSLVDLAPSILELAHADAAQPVDGTSFACAIEGGRGTPFDEPRTEAVFLEWAGDARIPAWTAVRTADLKLIRYGDGFEELYDIGGSLGSPDPWEMANVADDARYADVLTRLRALLGRVFDPR